jgi:TonB family protein
LSRLIADKLKQRFMSCKPRKFIFAIFSTKLFIALIFVFCTNVFCQTQAVADNCDFSEYKPLKISHFQKIALLEQVKPEYPSAAKAVGAQGKVRVKILVDRSGVVINACILEGHPLLRAAAIQAALDSRFKPNFGFFKKSRLKKTSFVTDELIYHFVKK